MGSNQRNAAVLLERELASLEKEIIQRENEISSMKSKIVELRSVLAVIQKDEGPITYTHKKKPFFSAEARERISASQKKRHARDRAARKRLAKAEDGKSGNGAAKP